MTDSRVGPAEMRTIARQVIEDEIEAIRGLLDRLDGNFDAAAEMLLNCKGRVIVTGVGKSGHVAHKIAASLASVGVPGFFIHSGEALHGDLGMVMPDDIVIMVSNSGETDELLAMLPFVCDHQKAKTIAITSRVDSTLGRSCSVVLDTGVRAEADPRRLAPTASTIATLALGDALAMAVSVAKGFTREDYHHRHPSGSLGKMLLRERQG